MASRSIRRKETATLNAYPADREQAALESIAAAAVGNDMLTAALERAMNNTSTKKLLATFVRSPICSILLYALLTSPQVDYARGNLLNSLQGKTKDMIATFGIPSTLSVEECKSRTRWLLKDSTFKFGGMDAAVSGPHFLPLTYLIMSLETYL